MKTIEKAIEFMQARQFAEAVKICHEIISQQPENQRAYFILASVSEMQNKDDEALTYLDKALAVDAPKPVILRKYGQILSRQSKPELAVEKFKAALEIKRTRPILLDLGLALLACNKPEEAKEVFEKTLSLDRNCLVSLHQLGRMAYEEGDTNRFIEYVEQERKLKPKDPRLIASLLMAYLESSSLQKARALCDEGLSIWPALCPLYAMKYIVLAELGELEAAREIMHFDSLLKRIPAKCPDTYSNLDELNNALVDYTKNQAIRATNEESYTTRDGWQTVPGKLFENNVELGSLVEKMIENAIQDYISKLPDDDNHPINLMQPKDYSVESWIVVLNTSGHQAPHIHPRSWLSGVYYIKLPEDFDQQQTPDAGHIGFGKGKEGLHHVDSPDTIVLKPTEGNFVIFPSYFWHHTIPLESKFERICLAFDVVPKVPDSE